MDNFRGRKVSLIGEKYNFCGENLHRLLAFAMPKDATPQNFTEKTFANSHKTTKFAESFLPWKFPAIRYTALQWDLNNIFKAVCIYHKHENIGGDANGEGLLQTKSFKGSAVMKDVSTHCWWLGPARQVHNQLKSSLAINTGSNSHGCRHYNLLLELSFYSKRGSCCLVAWQPLFLTGLCK